MGRSRCCKIRETPKADKCFGLCVRVRRLSGFELQKSRREQYAGIGMSWLPSTETAQY